MIHELRQKEFIRKKIIYLKDRVKENPLLKTILDEYLYLQHEKKSKHKISHVLKLNV